MKAKFRQWFAEQVARQLKDDNKTHPVDMRLSVMKPLSAQWLLSMFDYITYSHDVCVCTAATRGEIENNQCNLRGWKITHKG